MLPTNTHILFPEFEYHAPATVYEATELLAQYGDDARVMAGGTDLLVQMKMERCHPAHVISLARLTPLQEISQNGNLTIGARASIRTLFQHLTVSATARAASLYAPRSTLHAPQHYAALATACNAFSTIQIMHMATLGGNLCNASPAADTAPCLLAYNASVTLKSKTQERTVPVQEFFIGPGRTVMRAEELLTHIHIPLLPPSSGSAFIKMSRVMADISQVCAAVHLVRAGNIVTEARIALGSVAPIPLRVEQASADLIGQPFTEKLAEEAGAIAAEEIRPISDVRASREYRQRVAVVLVRDALLQAWENSASV